MIIKCHNIHDSIYFEFGTNIEIFKHNSITIATKYYHVIYYGNIRNNKQLKVGDKLSVIFRCR